MKALIERLGLFLCLSMRLIQIIFLIPQVVFCQPKFGEIGFRDLAMEKCPIDTAAGAFYLMDTGSSEFIYPQTTQRSNEPQGKGFQLKIQRHFRLKITSKKELDRGNLEIPLYRGDGLKEEVTRLDVIVYNKVDGKYQKSYQKNFKGFEEKFSDNLTIQKFAFEKVREGSLIEVRYTLISDFLYNLPTWYFQYEIPVLTSQYRTSVPEYFKYKTKNLGNVRLATDRSYNETHLDLKYIQKAEGRAIQASERTRTLRYQEEIVTYKASNIPALSEDEFLLNHENYFGRLEFEVESYTSPDGPVSYFTSSWTQINNNLWSDFRFGQYLSNAGQFKNEEEFLAFSESPSLELLRSVFFWWSRNVVWSGETGVVASQRPRATFTSRKGSVADINLMLVSMLRHLNFQADPVLVSTQSHGAVPPSPPTLSSFNYLIVGVNLNGRNFLLDATDPSSDLNVLPIRCLNGFGRVVNQGEGYWIRLSNKASKQTELYDLTVNETLTMNGTGRYRMEDYSSYNVRSISAGVKGLEKIQRLLEDNVTPFEINDLKILNPEKGNLVIDLNFKLSNHEPLEISGDVYTLNPIVSPILKKNPFASSQRLYPVEFDHAKQIKQIFKISIPDNLEILDLPKPLNLKMGNGGASFSLSVTHLGNVVSFMIDFERSMNSFNSDEYEFLSRFYTEVINAINQLVVLKEK